MAVVLQKIAARVPGFQAAAAAGTLVPTRRILRNLAPRKPTGEVLGEDFIEKRLGIETVAMSESTLTALEETVWSGSPGTRPFRGMDNVGYRFLARGGVVNKTLLGLVGDCMDEVLPSSASERAQVRRHIHVGIAPPADMDREMGFLRRAHGLPEFIPTEYVTMACPALPIVLESLRRVPVKDETLVLITGDNNMLPFLQQYAALPEEDATDINRWLYVSAFGEATGAALVRLLPTAEAVEDTPGWELLSAGVGRVPGVETGSWRGVISPEGAMHIGVKYVLPTYKSAMRKQFAGAMEAVKRRAGVATDEEAVDHLHRFCFHESNFLLLTEMAAEHGVPRDRIPGFSKHTGSPVGMSAFITLAAATQSWKPCADAARRAVGAAIVGQAGVEVGCGHIALHATRALGNNPAEVPMTREKVVQLLAPITERGDMRGFLETALAPGAQWRVVGGSGAKVTGEYTPVQLEQHWDNLTAALEPDDYCLSLDSVFVDPIQRTAIAQLHGEAPLKTGGMYRQAYCWVMSFSSNGRITTLEAYLDGAQVDTALHL